MKEKEQEEEEEEDEEACSSLIKVIYMHLSIPELNVTHTSSVLPELFHLTAPKRFREADSGAWGEIQHGGLWHQLSSLSRLVVASPIADNATHSTSNDMRR
jgi:hypothetical protein